MAERKVLLLRLRPAFYEALRRWAADDFRSVNGQLEYIVHRALLEAGRLPREGRSARKDPGDPKFPRHDETGGADDGGTP